ncbi:lipoprotein metalloendopeptidase, NlpD precursor [Psychroflexus gondwanensis ACAM 44]|jgi:murein DD-endopeptidase MepM/ murein hydrolase activator NlpD|uniref:Lipoprotein metalloendopeptidase, NlpD n=1 Tax=Psychroflexus gondwanensis ACAM 44 TaxID=1189619 RepID=N1WIY7_9FLAO|nr:M23 family metallopeptidase [Psychroflexus gondwanensis]EMY80221.1 lipoprotein metalloendopeptidase, NlpD precursor [Psychroflexus gondwanensis ACAM 44]
MRSPKKDKRKVKQKLLHKYRLVILNEDTFEERLSFQLSKLNVIILTAISTLLLISGTALLIAFTPIREFIPGYSSLKLKNKATRLTITVDSLTAVVEKNDVYFKSIRNMLTGQLDSLSTNDAYSINDAKPVDPETVNLYASQQDSILREKVEQEDKYSLLERATFNANFTLFPPVSGQISEEYNAEAKHYAVDIVTEKDEPVKATLDGTVIFSEWSVETGYVIIIEHSHGLISVYKHNNSLLKSQGDLVTAGEVIAVVGDTGEFSYGPHLHFELWVDGYPVNPSDYINFE